jgi:hypothetical protein
MGIGIEVEIGIEELLRETVEALSRLDAGRVEALAEAAERLAAEAGPGRAGWPETAAEWRRAAARHWVLGHLVGATARQLAVQRRVLDRARNAGDGFRGYRPEGDAGLAARLNAALAWPGGRGAAG